MHACIGEGNGNPLKYSCLENPRDGEAWRAAVYGVTQSLTLLKRLSSSSIADHDYKPSPLLDTVLLASNISIVFNTILNASHLLHFILRQLHEIDIIIPISLIRKL